MLCKQTARIPSPGPDLWPVTFLFYPEVPDSDSGVFGPWASWCVVLTGVSSLLSGYLIVAQHFPAPGRCTVHGSQCLRLRLWVRTEGRSRSVSGVCSHPPHSAVLATLPPSSTTTAAAHLAGKLIKSIGAFWEYLETINHFLETGCIDIVVIMNSSINTDWNP